MALENVAPLLAKEFVLLKLDYDRDTSASITSTKGKMTHAAIAA